MDVNESNTARSLERQVSIDHVPISRNALNEIRNGREVRTEIVVFNSEQETIECLALTEADFMLVLNDHKPLGSIAELIEEIASSGKSVPVLFFYFS